MIAHRLASQWTLGLRRYVSWWAGEPLHLAVRAASRQVIEQRGNIWQLASSPPFPFHNSKPPGASILLTFLVVRDVDEVLQLVWLRRGLFVLSLLPLVILNASLLPAGCLVVTTSDPLGDLGPKLPALGVALFLKRLDLDFTTMGAGIAEDGVGRPTGCLALELRHSRPFTLHCVESGSWLRGGRNGSLEAVALAREITFSRVVDGGQIPGTTANMTYTGKLQVRRA